MGIVVEFRDYQSPQAKERARKALEDHLHRQAMELANEAFPSVFGIDANHYHASDRDPA